MLHASSWLASKVPTLPSTSVDVEDFALWTFLLFSGTFLFPFSFFLYFVARFNNNKMSEY